jgi:hypothetical protein
MQPRAAGELIERGVLLSPWLRSMIKQQRAAFLQRARPTRG